MEWSREYCGLIHLSDRRSGVSVTVQDFTGSACLKIYYPNSGAFSPERKWFSTVNAAKKAGEQVMRRVT